MDELVVLPFHQAQRFGVELERCALFVDGGNALKQLFIQADRILVRGHLGR